METVDTENILDRLREIVADTDPNPYTYQYLIETCDRAANEIERLQQEVSRLGDRRPSSANGDEHG